MYKKEDINFDWKYSPDFREEYLSPGFDDGDFISVQIPHTNIETPYNNFDEKMSQFISTYRKKIRIPRLDRDDRIFIRFEAVMTCAEVYLNGRFAGEHKGGYTPFRLDLTESVLPEAENTLAIKVDSRERADIPPFGFVVDYLPYGGIYREVSLEYCHQLHIETLGIKTRNVLTEQPYLEADLYFHNHNQTPQEVSVQFEMFCEGNFVESFSATVRVNGEKKQKITLEHPVGKIRLWDTGSPSLYTLKVDLFSGKTCLDSLSSRFGFREAVFTEKGFFLNGRKMKILGLNRHQSFPYTGYAMPRSAQEKDAEILKYELGVNTVRLSHYPQSDHFINRCDEIGLLVFDEIPGWQHIGDESWQTIALQNVREMILKDMNHPSVIIWGVRINESLDNDGFYQKTNALAKSLDDTRATGGVRYLKNSRLYEDVYTYNDFVHNGLNRGLDKKVTVTKTRRPYLVTEHNGHMFPTKKFDDESHRLEQARRHLNVINAMNKSPFISGALGWCMFDYNTHKEFGSGDRICYHGVMDMFRIPKEAAYVYQSQQSRNPVMHVAGSLNIGEYEGSLLGEVPVFTNCDFVKLYKNGSYVNTFYPDRKKYRYVDHPPVIIDDFIGDAILKNEKFSPSDSLIMKKLLQSISKNGMKLSPGQMIQTGWLFLKYRMNVSQARDLFTKYIGGWGTASSDYLFEGYMDDKAVITVRKSQVFKPRLTARADCDVLRERETYDTGRVVLNLTDENGNPLVYAHDPVTLSVSGPISVIGPRVISLIGGSVAFWVRTAGESGLGTIRITSERFGELEKHFEVIKET